MTNPYQPGGGGYPGYGYGYPTYGEAGGLLFGQADVMRAYGMAINAQQQGADHAAASGPGPARHPAQALRARDVHQGQHADVHRGAGQGRPDDPEPHQDELDPRRDRQRQVAQPHARRRQAASPTARFPATACRSPRRCCCSSTSPAPTWASAPCATTAASTGPSACRSSSRPRRARRSTPRPRPSCRAPPRARSIPNTFRDFSNELDRTYDALVKKVNDLGPHYLEAKRFLTDLKDARRALEKGEAQHQLNYMKWVSNGGGKSVQDVADYMLAKGLRFAPGHHLR